MLRRKTVSLGGHIAGGFSTSQERTRDGDFPWYKTEVCGN